MVHLGVLILGLLLLVLERFDANVTRRILEALISLLAIFLVLPNLRAFHRSVGFYLRDFAGIQRAINALRVSRNPFRQSTAALLWLAAAIGAGSLALDLPWLAISFLYACVAVSTTLLRNQPPVALFLGASSTSGDLYARIAAACMPLRCASLLDVTADGERLRSHRITGPLDPLADLQFAVRTGEDSWSDLVALLLDHVRLIVLDARATTANLAAEAKLILAQDLLFKTLFVIEDQPLPPSGVLGVHGDVVASSSVAPASAPSVVRSLTREPEDLPSRDRPIGERVREIRACAPKSTD